MMIDEHGIASIAMMAVMQAVPVVLLLAYCLAALIAVVRGWVGPGLLMLIGAGGNLLMALFRGLHIFGVHSGRFYLGELHIYFATMAIIGMVFTVISLVGLFWLVLAVPRCRDAKRLKQFATLPQTPPPAPKVANLN